MEVRSSLFQNESLKSVGMSALGDRIEILRLVQGARQQEVENSVPIYHFSFENRPKKLCQRFGSDWKFQQPDQIENELPHHILSHFRYWKERKFDKTLHPLFICFSAPGSGKSRLMDEFQNLLLNNIHLGHDCCDYI